MTRTNGKAKKKPFVKSASTDVPVTESRESITTLLKRHGAKGFGVQENYHTGIVTVSFVLPTEQGSHVPIQIPIDVGKVYAAMYAQPRAAGGDRYKDDPERIEQRREQAERVAWRQLHFIIDATLTAAALGMMRVSDVFLAHTMVVSDDGRSERMADYLDRTQGALTPGVRALLPSSTT
jgi:hypothetical protein